MRTIAMATCMGLLLAACSTNAPMLAVPELQTLAGTAWQLAQTTQKRSSESGVATVEFIDDQHVAGNLECNRYRGNYAADVSGLVFGKIVSTRKLCAAPEMEREKQFEQTLASTRGVRFDRGTLLFVDANGAVLANLERLK